MATPRTPRRRIDPTVGRAALNAWRAAAQATPDVSSAVERGLVATAVRYSLEELASRQPGGALEVRVPPYGATQCLAGPQHRRGTPPAVVEMAPEVWLGLVTGSLRWADAVAEGSVDASGARADLSAHLPLD